MNESKLRGRHFWSAAAQIEISLVKSDRLDDDASQNEPSDSRHTQADYLLAADSSFNYALKINWSTMCREDRLLRAPCRRTLMCCLINLLRGAWTCQQKVAPETKYFAQISMRENNQKPLENDLDVDDWLSVVPCTSNTDQSVVFDAWWQPNGGSSTSNADWSSTFYSWKDAQGPVHIGWKQVSWELLKVDVPFKVKRLMFEEYQFFSIVLFEDSNTRVI